MQGANVERSRTASVGERTESRRASEYPTIEVEFYCIANRGGPAIITHASC